MIRRIRCAGDMFNARGRLPLAARNRLNAAAHDFGPISSEN